MKLLLIDASEEDAWLVKQFLSSAVPGVFVDVRIAGSTGDDLNDIHWSQFDAAFIEYALPDRTPGLGWLGGVDTVSALPPIIALASSGDEYIAVEAMRAGASSYLNKRDLSPSRLSDLLKSVLKHADYPASDDGISNLTTFSTANADMFAAESEKTTPLFESMAHKRESENEAPKIDGRSIGYRLFRAIGKGAMSEVFLAERRSDRRTAVVKILDLRGPDLEELKLRFVREAALISSVRSPYVVKIFDHGFTDEFGYIAMEFFARGDLKHRIERGLTPDQALLYLVNIAWGLAAIHKAGIVHRDLKPMNIMFRSNESLALADFGVSKRLGEESGMTMSGTVLGTPVYMSPEQGQGRDTDERSDLYSAGVIFYEMLTGNKPFRAQNPVAIIKQHVEAPIPRLSSTLKEYQDVIDRLLAKQASERIRSARELANELIERWG